jgi:fatty-acyl-CoA synthase
MCPPARDGDRRPLRSELCATVERNGSRRFFVDTIAGPRVCQRDRHDLSSLRTGTGAPLSTESFLFARTIGYRSCRRVRMSETSNAVARGAARPSTSGRPQRRPVDGVKSDRRRRQQRHVGRARSARSASAPLLMKGYYKLPEEDAKRSRQGYCTAAIRRTRRRRLLVYRAA